MMATCAHDYLSGDKCCFIAGLSNAIELPLKDNVGQNGIIKQYIDLYLYLSFWRKDEAFASRLVDAFHGSWDLPRFQASLVESTPERLTIPLGVSWCLTVAFRRPPVSETPAPALFLSFAGWFTDAVLLFEPHSSSLTGKVHSFWSHSNLYIYLNDNNHIILSDFKKKFSFKCQRYRCYPLFSILVRYQR